MGSGHAGPSIEFDLEDRHGGLRPRIVDFEIYADDVDRAGKFCANQFVWEFDK